MPTEDNIGDWSELVPKSWFQIFLGLPLALYRTWRAQRKAGDQIPLKENLTCFVLRQLSHLPIETLQKNIPPRDINALRTCNRFSNYANDICNEVVADKWRGFWFCKGAPGKPKIPRECNVVLFYIVGGAYCFGDPLTFSTSALRIAEILDENGISASVFAVNYSQAPVACFPAQQSEVVAAYKYLIETEAIGADKIIIAGDSAGAHLVLTSLMMIAQNGDLPKPGASLLLCPWVNLRNSSPSFNTNKHRDMLTKNILDRSAQAVMGSAPLLEYMDLTVISSDRWAQILPPKLWIGFGTHELLLDDIRAFITNVEAAGDSVAIETEAAEGKVHGWQLVANWGTEKDYLQLHPDQVVPAEIMPGSASIAKGLLWLCAKNAHGPLEQ